MGNPGAPELGAVKGGRGSPGAGWSEATDTGAGATLDRGSRALVRRAAQESSLVRMHTFGCGGSRGPLPFLPRRFLGAARGRVLFRAQARWSNSKSGQSRRRCRRVVERKCKGPRFRGPCLAYFRFFHPEPPGPETSWIGSGMAVRSQARFAQPRTMAGTTTQGNKNMPP